MKIPSQQSGFTLLEIIVVIGIIGVLATVGLFTYSDAREQARDNTRINDLQQIRLALETYKADWGSYPSDSDNGVVCSDSDVQACSPLNNISQIVLDYGGSEIADPSSGQSGFGYEYNADDDCNASYSIITLTAQMETTGASNADDLPSQCDALNPASDEYIIILDFVE